MSVLDKAIAASEGLARGRRGMVPAMRRAFRIGQDGQQVKGPVAGNVETYDDAFSWPTISILRRRRGLHIRPFVEETIVSHTRSLPHSASTSKRRQ